MQPLVGSVKPSVRRVLIIQRYLAQYRRAFYERLRPQLEGRGIELELAHGFPHGDEARKGDAVSLPWSTPITNRSFSVGSLEVVWQPVLRLALRADMVVVEHATRFPFNYIISSLPRRLRPVLALWGHGRNFRVGQQASPKTEVLRRWLLQRSDYYFAYNDLSASVVLSYGYQADRIASINNAIDTSGLRTFAMSLSFREIQELRHKWGLGPGPIGIMVSGLYAEKRIPFLLEAAEHLRNAIPSFELIVVGGGPQGTLVQSAAAQCSWLHYFGPQFGTPKEQLLALSDVTLMPGLVGLGVLDSFAAGTPLITVAGDFHSPEISYVSDGLNGRILPRNTDPLGFASAVADLLGDTTELDRLKKNSQTSSLEFSVDEMALRFASGVERALSMFSRR